MDRKTLIGVLQNSGVVGAGGAGFPTHAKLDPRGDTIILNCAECEPLLRLHRQLLEKHADQILEAFRMIGQAVGAKEMIIGIKAAYTDTIAALQEAIAEEPSYGEIRLGILDEIYPAGDEMVLIYELTGTVIKPGGIPIESGIAVFNVETVYNVYQAVTHRQSVRHKLVSVVGEVMNPLTLRAAVGTSMKELVAMAGGSRIEDPVYFIGGPMMGFIGSPKLPVTKTTNAVLVLPQDHLLVQRKKTKASLQLKRAAAACCQCSMCSDLCPRNRLGHPVWPHKFMRAASFQDVKRQEVFVNTMFCSSCGLCELYSCMQGLSPRSLMAEFKTSLREHGIKSPPGILPEPMQEGGEYRKVPIERLIARLDLTQYNKDAPLKEQIQQVNRVKIMLSQHIGAPAKAMVSKGDKVKEGQMIGAPDKGLSVAVHASITGNVTKVTEKYVIIERQDGC